MAGKKNHWEGKNWERHNIFGKKAKLLFKEKPAFLYKEELKIKLYKKK
jgi:hypothetical protein